MRTPLSTILAAMALIIVPNASFANFLTNGNFSDGNSGFSSEYFYIPSGSNTHPQTYGIISNPAVDFTNGYASFGDHTTGTGKMLFFDGAGAQYAIWSETVSVTADTALSFTGWATSGTSSNPPIIALTVNGVAVLTDFRVSAAIPGQWQQFTASFNSGSATTLKLSLYDVNPTNLLSGDDGAFDDLNLAPAVPEPPSILLLSLASLGLGIGHFCRRSDKS